MGKFAIISNPYAGIDWDDTPRVKAVSHEHVFNADKLAKMYDRGIRFFASVHYVPACPRYPFSSFSETYEDWLYYDLLGEYADAVAARKAVPDTISGVTTNYKQQGLVVGYLENSVHKYTKLTRNLSAGETWDELCEDGSAWVSVAEADLNANLVRKNKTLTGGFPTFQSRASASAWTGLAPISFAGDGLQHNSDDFPRIPNAEHTLFVDIEHFNVLGTTTPEASWSVGIDRTIRPSHPLWDLDDVGTLFSAASSFYDGKLFGTWNHNYRIDRFKTFQNKYPWMVGYEVFNNGMSRADNENYLAAFHTLLNEGRKVFCCAVTDHQDDFGGFSDVDGGTNVLYLPDNYDSMTLANKSKAGMDSYMGGRFVASRFGVNRVTAFSINEASGTATFSVSAQAHTLSLVFNGQRVSVNNASTITAPIPAGTTNVTGEALFADGNGDIWKSESKLADEADFLFTQAIIVRGAGNNTALRMFALDKTDPL